MDLRKLAWLLLAAGGWTLWVWGTRVYLLTRQEASAAFKAVHFGLAAVSLAFGVALLWAGVRLLRG